MKIKNPNEYYIFCDQLYLLDVKEISEKEVDMLEAIIPYCQKVLEKIDKGEIKVNKNNKINQEIRFSTALKEGIEVI
jgi:hypothetical protein